jgi:hypothetical protein
MITKLRYIIFVNLLVILLTGGNLSPVSQEVYKWSPQQRIPDYQNRSYPTFFLADQNKTVHAFSSQWIGEDVTSRAIIYNKWTLDQGWTKPVDILLSPFKAEARLLGAFLDKAGWMHVIFFGGDNTQANIYYSKAPADHADKVNAWSIPALVAEGALDPENGAIKGDDNGNMIILFSGNLDGNGIYAIYSADYGESWSAPEGIFLTNNDKLFPYESKLYLSSSGDAYTVWSIYDVAGQGASVNFSRLNTGQQLWSKPLTFAVGTGLGVSHPNIIEYDGYLIIAYYNYNENAQWLIESKDDGQSWTEPVRIAPTHIGRNGPVSLVIDSKDVLHMFFGERIPGNPDIHGMWHVTYYKGQLGPVEAVVSGPMVIDKLGGNGFDPVEAKAVVVQGNLLFVAWVTDPGIPFNGVWYSYSKLNAPELPVIPLPSQPVLPDITSTETVAPPPVVTPTISIKPTVLVGVTGMAQTAISISTVSSPMTPFVFGIIPTLLLIIVVMIFSLYRSKRR